MDRRFLSNEQIIKISRDFVCIRLATYEDKTEAVFLKETFLGQRGGDLRNFGYCILSPDGKKNFAEATEAQTTCTPMPKPWPPTCAKSPRNIQTKTKENKSNRTVPRMKKRSLGR